MNTPTRRGLLGGAAALAAAPVAAHATPLLHPDADADLLALAERFIAHTRFIHETMPCDAETEAEEAVQEVEQRRLFEMQHALVMQMGELRATTAGGIAARARCLAVHNVDGAFSMYAPDTTTGRLLRWLMRDAAALGGAAPGAAEAVSPDAELMEACAAFDALERESLATFAGTDEEAQSPAVEAERERLSDAQLPLIDCMCEMRAFTQAGHAARASSLALWDAELMKPGRGDRGTALTAAIVRDLIGAPEA